MGTLALLREMTVPHRVSIHTHTRKVSDWLFRGGLWKCPCTRARRRCSQTSVCRSLARISAWRVAPAQKTSQKGQNRQRKTALRVLGGLLISQYDRTGDFPALAAHLLTGVACCTAFELLLSGDSSRHFCCVLLKSPTRSLLFTANQPRIGFVLLEVFPQRPDETQLLLREARATDPRLRSSRPPRDGYSCGGGNGNGSGVPWSVHPHGCRVGPSTGHAACSRHA